jgi:hypothetical protein
MHKILNLREKKFFLKKHISNALEFFYVKQKFDQANNIAHVNDVVYAIIK